MERDFGEILETALGIGKERHPEAHVARHAAFANSVAHLVTGWSGGYGGPSLREHAVSWELASDARLPAPGEWSLDAACQFAEPIVYGPLPAICRRIAEVEYHFDDDPADLDALKSSLALDSEL